MSLRLNSAVKLSIHSVHVHLTLGRTIALATFYHAFFLSIYELPFSLQWFQLRQVPVRVMQLSLEHNFFVTFSLSENAIRLVSQ